MYSTATVTVRVGDDRADDVAALRFSITALNGAPLTEVNVGDEFDPNLHEAMMRQPSDEIESNHVTAQLHPGYSVNGKTVRPAGVIIAE